LNGEMIDCSVERITTQIQVLQREQERAKLL